MYTNFQHYHTDSLPVDLGLAWVWERSGGGSGLPVVSKRGQVGGFNAELIVDRAGARVAAVVTNTATFSANDLAEQLIPLQIPDPT